jgi:hypothetical protein
MEREELEAVIRRYTAILNLTMDDRVVATLTAMIAEARDRLSKIDQDEALPTDLSPQDQTTS